MGKTIALKLSEKEHQVVTQINKQGMTNSQLLRAALRQYFENSPKSSSQDYSIDTTLFTEKNQNAEISISVQELRQEIRELWNQMEKKQKQVDDHIMTLQRQIFLRSIGDPFSKHTTDSMKVDTMCDIHSEIDEFLKKQKNW